MDLFLEGDEKRKPVAKSYLKGKTRGSKKHSNTIVVRRAKMTTDI